MASNGCNPLLASWRGGKSKLAKYILPLFPRHVCYVEAFAGAAWLLFSKNPSKVEVINDLDGEVANVYRVIRDNWQELADKFKYAIASREIFEEAVNADISKLNPVMRAWRFLYLLKQCFSGEMKNPSYGYSTKEPISKILQVEDAVTFAYGRLKKVNVECLDYKEILERYDSQDTFFYLDPPYLKDGHKRYRFDFEKDEFMIMAKCLENLKGKFLLSLTDNPEMRIVFGNFEIRELEIKYDTSKCKNENGNKKAKSKELLVANYPIPKNIQSQIQENFDLLLSA